MADSAGEPIAEQNAAPLRRGSFLSLVGEAHAALFARINTPPRVSPSLEAILPGGETDHRGEDIQAASPDYAAEPPTAFIHRSFAQLRRFLQVGARASLQEGRHVSPPFPSGGIPPEYLRKPNQLRRQSPKLLQEFNPPFGRRNRRPALNPLAPCGGRMPLEPIEAF